MYDYFEHDRARKFFKKHKHDKKLLLRINKKYVEIITDPYRSDFAELKSNLCPKCRRAKVGDYRIVFYISENKNLVEIVDVFHRSNDYKSY